MEWVTLLRPQQPSYSRSESLYTEVREDRLLSESDDSEARERAVAGEGGVARFEALAGTPVARLLCFPPLSERG